MLVYQYNPSFKFLEKLTKSLTRSLLLTTLSTAEIAVTMLELPQPGATGGIILLLLAYPFAQAIYNVYFHPLKNIPGPKLWAATRLPYIWALLRGTIVHDLQKLHRKYGCVLRIAPDEVTFNDPSAFDDILQTRPGKPEFLKDPTWWGKQVDQDESLITTIEPEPHARMRKALAPGFTTRALKAQETHIQRYVNLLVDRLSGIIDSSAEKASVIDIGPWFNFTTFDILGDLAFGESFDCLHSSMYHPWVEILFSAAKAATWIASVRFYPRVYSLLYRLIPPSLKKMSQDHFNHVVERVKRRMNYEMDREDLMSPVLKEDAKHKMSLQEINGSFMTLVVAGSETSATVLTGLMNHLVQTPQYLKRLEGEVRGLGRGAAQEITLDSLRQLEWLNAVLTEALRLCTPVPWILPRRVPATGGVVAGVELPGHTRVSIQAYTMNRDPVNWHRAEEFLPERWLPGAHKPESEFYRDRRESLQPFSVGSRACIGLHLAWAELRLILTKLIRAFDFEEVEGERLAWESLRTFALVEKKPVYVRMRHASR